MKAESLVPRGGSLVTLDPSANPLGSLSGRACKWSNFWTSISASEVLGLAFMVSISGGKVQLGVAGSAGIQGNMVFSKT